MVILNILGVAFFSGMRTGEVLGLEWKNVDFEDSIISITKTKTAGITKRPKTKSSIIEIDMLSEN